MPAGTRSCTRGAGSAGARRPARRGAAGAAAEAPRAEAGPGALFPRSLSVTEIETLVRDPAASSPATCSGSTRLDPLAAAPGVATRGSLVHDVFAEFAGRHPTDLPPDSAERLLNLAVNALRRHRGGVPEPLRRVVAALRAHGLGLSRLGGAAPAGPDLGLPGSLRALGDPDGARDLPRCAPGPTGSSCGRTAPPASSTTRPGRRPRGR
ncbi:hypothetical protein ACU4GA_14535 [Methylobacterium oryzae CBMB20]